MTILILVQEGGMTTSIVLVAADPLQPWSDLKSPAVRKESKAMQIFLSFKSISIRPTANVRSSFSSIYLKV